MAPSPPCSPPLIQPLASNLTSFLILSSTFVDDGERDASACYLAGLGCTAALLAQVGPGPVREARLQSGMAAATPLPACSCALPALLSPAPHLAWLHTPNPLAPPPPLLLPQAHWLHAVPPALFWPAAALALASAAVNAAKLAGLLDAPGPAAALWPLWRRVVGCVGWAMVPQVTAVFMPCCRTAFLIHLPAWGTCLGRSTPAEHPRPRFTPLPPRTGRLPLAGAAGQHSARCRHLGARRRVDGSWCRAAGAAASGVAAARVAWRLGCGLLDRHPAFHDEAAGGAGGRTGKPVGGGAGCTVCLLDPAAAGAPVQAHLLSLSLTLPSRRVPLPAAGLPNSHVTTDIHALCPPPGRRRPGARHPAGRVPRRLPAACAGHRAAGAARAAAVWCRRRDRVAHVAHRCVCV